MLFYLHLYTWNNKSTHTPPPQIERIKILSSQINYAAKKYKNIMILGDANWDMNKWNEPKYKYANVTQVHSYLQAIQLNSHSYSLNSQYSL